MAVQERVFDVEAFWHFVCQPENADKRFELIDGEVIEMVAPGGEHGFIAGEIYYYFRLFDPQRKMGIATVESGYYSLDDRHTVLAPDVAFTRTAPGTRPHKKWMTAMPDIAVEVKSPNDRLDALRQKAAMYLQRETQLVWIIIPESKGVEVCTLDEDGEMLVEFIGVGGSLSGEDVLPGFRLQLASLFS